MSDVYLETLDCMTLKQLRKRLAHSGLSTVGKKEDLKQRLLDLFERRQGQVGAHTESKYELDHRPASTSAYTPSLRGGSPHRPNKSTQQAATNSTREHSKSAKEKRKAELKRMLMEMENASDEDSENDEEYKQQLSGAQVYGGHLMFEKLPAPTPPVFSGNVLEYNDWKVAFDGLIGHLPLQPTQKFYYLKQYLSGKALNAVSSFFLSNTERAYIRARKLLDERFGDPYLLCREIQGKLKAWPRISNRDHEGLRDFSDFLAKCSTLKEEVQSLNYLDNLSEILELTQKLPDWVSTKWNDRAYDYREKHKEHPNFEWFTKFLRRESDKACDSVYSMAALKRTIEPTPKRETNPSTKPEKKSTVRKNATDTQTTKPPPAEKKDGCSYCKATHHSLPNCTDFTMIPIAERQKFIQANGWCFGCLVEKHRSKECKKRETCTVCSKSHPSVLHRDIQQKKPVGDTTEVTTKDKANSHNTESHNINLGNANRYWSMTVPVFVSSKSDPSREILTYALLDTQSDTTFGVSEVLDKIDGEPQKTQLKLSTMTSRDELVDSRIYSDLQVRGYTGTKMVNLPPIYSRDYIPVTESHIPTYENVKQIGHLKHIAPFIPPKLDCGFGLLIGYDCSQALLPRQVESGGDGEPYAVKTDLGWSVVGTSTARPTNTDCHHAETYPIRKTTHSTVCLRVKSSTKEVIPAQDVLQILDQDFKDTHDRASAIPGNVDKLSQEDMKFMEIISNSIRQDEKGYYSMPLPLKDNYTLPDNRFVAEKRFKSLLKRLENDSEYSTKYRDFMKGLIDRGEAEPVDESTDTQPGMVWYLPHHGVTHPRKPGKIRVVWDCSSRCNGFSLNDILLQGPDMNNTLLGVLLRFRLGEIAISCDIEKMFFQFRVPPDQRDLLRFLWFNDNGQVSTFRMTVHLFGAVSSPSCAIYGLKRLAMDYGGKYPQAERFINKHFYVDDGLVSTDSTEDAIKMAQQSIEMCKEANVRLCKFASTSNTVLESIPASECSPNSSTQDLLPQVSSALGVTWLIDSDEFNFRLELRDTPLNRRGILSTVSSIYDPLGLISPILLQGKQILKEICELGKGWDEELPDEIVAKWEGWRTGVIALADVKFPRCMKPVGFGNAIIKELHHFADASQVGYGCTSYLRQVNGKGEVSCRLLMAKARVAPSKVTTIPRLELQAATVSMRVSKLLKQEEVPATNEFFYSDSEIVLAYLANDAKRFHTYVANRVQQIKNHTDVSQWRHVPTDDNPADLASRGTTVDGLIHSIWFQGPGFLHSKEYSPSSPTDFELRPDDPDVRSSTSHVIQSQGPVMTTLVERLKRFSSLHSAVRAMEVLGRLARRFQQDNNDSSLTQLTRNYGKASTVVTRAFQREYYSEEMDILASGDLLPKKNHLNKLDPYVDNDGILRVGGRLSKALELTDATRNPIIIPRKSHLATLVIGDCHDLHHQGRGITIAEIRNRGFWIVGCTAAVKSFIYHCITCRKLRHSPQSQKMGDLPEFRTEASGPFTHTGMDCFGPFQVKNGRKYSKVYGIVFTCLTSRAVHLEMLDDLSSDSFINALRSLIAIRGQVSTLVSDQGTNFKGASTELKAALGEMDNGKLKDFVSQHMIDFRFNPPSASHAGGVWERQIRTIRSILTTMLTRLTHPPDSTTMRVFLYEAMAVINSRPLSNHTLNDPTSQKPLTPNDILIMKTSVIVPMPGKFDDEYPKKRWRYVQSLCNVFWKRWKEEYLTQLQTRQKWHSPQRNLKIGDLVMIKDENEFRGHWPVGMIHQVHPGTDGLVRRVVVALGGKLDSSGRRVGDYPLLERPVQKVILLMESD